MGPPTGPLKRSGLSGTHESIVVVLDHPLGAAKARNVGIAAARTPWVAFLDNDDLWAPTKLELQLKALARLPERALVRHCVRLCGWRPEHVAPVGG